MRLKFLTQDLVVCKLNCINGPAEAEVVFIVLDIRVVHTVNIFGCVIRTVIGIEFEPKTDLWLIPVGNVSISLSRIGSDL